MSMKDHDLIKRVGGNDVADWGEKDQRGAYAPGTTFTVNGQTVDPNKLAPISDVDAEPVKGKRRAPVRSS